MVRSEPPAIESVDRALRMLEALSRHGSGSSLDELASSLALPKSSLHRTLAALRERGFATQREDGRYLLGPELLRIAFDFYDRLDVRVWLRPTLERLRADLNETIHLGVLDGSDVVYVDKLEPTHPIALSSKIGGRNPAHCTAVGKALLAWTYPTDAALHAWADEHAPLSQRTPKTIDDPTALAREMTRIRADGYAKDLEESEPGVKCVAAPVFFGGSTPVAAISISAPKERLPAPAMRGVIDALRREIPGGAPGTPAPRSVDRMASAP
jgi:IclR family transcriptional regulator, acetate operon repressor